MVRSFIRHHVRDYPAWREVYDGAATMQHENGVRAKAVFRDVGDPHTVIVTHDFDDAAAAQAFFELPGLKERMEAAGVDSEPEFWLAEAVD